jgi:hypothetical protein
VKVALGDRRQLGGDGLRSQRFPKARLARYPCHPPNIPRCANGRPRRWAFHFTPTSVALAQRGRAFLRRAPQGRCSDPSSTRKLSDPALQRMAAMSLASHPATTSRGRLRLRNPDQLPQDRGDQPLKRVPSQREIPCGLRRKKARYRHSAGSWRGISLARPEQWLPVSAISMPVGATIFTRPKRGSPLERLRNRTKPERPGPENSTKASHSNGLAKVE